MLNTKTTRNSCKHVQLWPDCQKIECQGNPLQRSHVQLMDVTMKGDLVIRGLDQRGLWHMATQALGSGGPRKGILGTLSQQACSAMTYWNLWKSWSNLLGLWTKEAGVWESFLEVIVRGNSQCTQAVYCFLNHWDGLRRGHSSTPPKTNTLSWRAAGNRMDSSISSPLTPLQTDSSISSSPLTPPSDRFVFSLLNSQTD